MGVTELGYLGLGVSDLEAWKTFARDILALEVVDENEGDRCYLRMDYWHHRMVLHRERSDDLAYLGFRVAGPDEFLAMQKQLADAGIEFRVGSLVTGAGGLGHCIIRQRDPEAATRFYQALGMRGGVEYKFGVGARTLQLRFMHCNERDHSVAWGIGSPDKRLNHIMLEVDNFDDVGLTQDLVRKAKIPVHIQLGKHSNDHMVSFYFRSPSGFAIEVGTGARPATHQSEYYSEDVYGHAPEEGGF